MLDLGKPLLALRLHPFGSQFLTHRLADLQPFHQLFCIVHDFHRTNVTGVADGNRFVVNLTCELSLHGGQKNDQTIEYNEVSQRVLKRLCRKCFQHGLFSAGLVWRGSVRAISRKGAVLVLQKPPDASRFAEFVRPVFVSALG